MTFKVLHMIPAVQGKSSEIIIINNKKLTKYFYSKLLLPTVDMAGHIE